MKKFLAWNPRDRIEPAAALEHSFFTGPIKCKCGKEFEFIKELKDHQIEHINLNEKIEMNFDQTRNETETEMEIEIYSN